MYDVLIIGAGISGATVARELSKYELNIAVLEKNNDVADETTKANSGIVHGGYDCKPNSLMAKYNVLGNQMYEELCKELHVAFKKNGSLVIAFNETELNHLKELYKRGKENGVKKLELLNKEEIKKIEKNISDDVIAALYCEDAGIVGPWEFTEALIDNSIENGVKVHLETMVTGIKKEEDMFIINTNNGEFKSKLVINCAGVNADLIHNLIAPKSYTILPRSGEYYVLDKKEGERVKHTVFQCPSEHGKGVLVAPTVHGNLLVGPDSVEMENRDDLSTSTKRLESIRTQGSRSIKNIDFRENIRNFSGMRSENDRGDFIVEESSVAGFYDIGGIKSPGLSSAPAIALDMVKMIGVKIKLINKEKFVTPKEHILFMKLSSEEKAELIKKNSSYGRVICRCEMITEGEIIEAIHRPLVAKTVDGIKRRVRPGTGKCQGGFCGPRVQEIISKELKIPLEKILLNKNGSYILTEETKK